MSALLSAIHNTGQCHIRRRAARLSSSCIRFAISRPQPPQLLRPAWVDLANMTCCATAKGPHNRCNESAPKLLPRCFACFCQIAIWRRIAWERRRANHRPSDGKIKAAACGTVGRQNRTNRSGSWRSVRESMTACGFAQLIEQSKLCAPRVFRPKLQQARSHDRLARRCRTAAGPSRLALCTTGAAGLRP